MPLFQAGGFVTDHRSPLAQRWGGWYVTGTHGKQRHMGNVFAEDRDHPEQLDREQGANVTDLKGRIDTGTYLSPHSDIVALMVLEHQTRMANLITRVNYETRMALYEQKAINQSLKEPEDQIGDSARRRIDNAAEALLKYLLFTDEAKLEGAIKGTSGFAAEFTARGPRDRPGALAARIGPDQPDAPVSVQLADLFGGVRRAAADRARAHLSNGSGRCLPARTDACLCAPHRRRSHRHSRDSPETKKGLPGVLADVRKRPAAARRF